MSEKIKVDVSYIQQCGIVSIKFSHELGSNQSDQYI